MEYTVRDRVSPAASRDVKLGSFSKLISDRFFEERVFCDFAKNVIYQETEDAFVNQIDDAEFIGVWQGEFWGKWILSAVEVCKMTGDAELKSFVQNAAHKLLSLAREDGYLNTYKNSLNVFRVDPKEAKLKCNKSVDWNWNIWCRKYTLWGLLSVYELTGDAAILAGARRLADHLIDELAANGIELRKTGTFVGLPSCSILKPMLLLYRYTDDAKYYNFALHEIGDNWDREDNACPNLIKNGIEGKRITDWYPNSPSWAKAYEMMSCYEGLCELYRYTANERHLKAAEGVYEILKKYELNPAFSVAYNDVFADAADEINLISEPCDAIHWMRLCYELFCLTGNVKYIDTIELAYYNAFLAGVFRDGKWGARGVRGAACHNWAFNQAGMQYQHCCVNNMPRAFARIAEVTLMQSEEAVFLNLYEASTASIAYEGGSVAVEIKSGYFANGAFEVDVTYTGKQKPIRFRIPAWTKKAEIVVGGVTYTPEAGYFEILPTESSFTVSFDFHTEAVVHTFDKPVNPYTELVDGKPHWKRARWICRKAPGEPAEERFLEEVRCTITYGPLLLARSCMIGNTAEEMFEGDWIDGSFSCQVVDAREDAGSVRLMLDVTLTNGEKTIAATVCDYASAGDLMPENPDYFSIYF